MFWQSLVVVVVLFFPPITNACNKLFKEFKSGNVWVGIMFIREKI